MPRNGGDSISGCDGQKQPHPPRNLSRYTVSGSKEPAGQKSDGADDYYLAKDASSVQPILDSRETSSASIRRMILYIPYRRTMYRPTGSVHNCFSTRTVPFQPVHRDSITSRRTSRHPSHLRHLHEHRTDPPSPWVLPEPTRHGLPWMVNCYQQTFTVTMDPRVKTGIND